MMICMMIGFIMLGRLSYDYAIRQLLMASLALGVCLLVPLFMLLYAGDLMAIVNKGKKAIIK